MGQALYRKYRSKSLKEIVGQEHITDTLSRALKQGRISHAYLFTGPKGVGKTSIARILAHEINGLRYEDDAAHIDVIEIDAASNRRIDEIRDLRDKVYIAPAQAKYKVYIIDEVHMLTREAFNALLKTLEEPPAHVVFILATTEAHKLPETIISRTQRFTFRPIEPAKVIRHLQTIADQEKIQITPEALAVIAEHGEGSFRDSISLLDQLASQGGKIDAEQVRTSLGIPPRTAIAALLHTLQETASAQTILKSLTALYDQGFQAATIAKELAHLIRLQWVDGTQALDATKTALLLQKLLDVSASHDPQRYLEIVLLSLAGSSTTASAAKAAVATPAPQSLKGTDPPTPASTAATPKISKKPKTGDKLNAATWNTVLADLKSHHNTLYGIARMAQPDFTTPGTVTLTFAFAFHQKRMGESKNQQIILAAIQAALGTDQSVEIVCLVDPDLKLASKPMGRQRTVAVPPKSNKASGSLATISNIFGGAEVLES